MVATLITINGIEWAVFFVDKTDEHLVDEINEQDAYGITLMRECEIYVDNGLPKGLMRKVVTHELVHAIAFSYGVEMDELDEEQICEFIAVHFDELKTHRKAILKAL